MGMDRTSTRPSVAPSSVYQDLCVCFFGFTVFFFYCLNFVLSQVQFSLCCLQHACLGFLGTIHDDLS